MDARTPTRRELLGAIGGAAALVVLNPFTGLTGGSGLSFAATGAVTIDEFMALSEALTDDAFDLQRSVGAQYLAALDPAAIRKLVDATKGKTTFAAILASGGLNDEKNALTAQQILTYWYSGLVNNKTADYLEAVAWQALEDDDLAVVSSEKYGFPKWEDAPS